MISILIVDDDINKITSIIESIHNYYQDVVEVKQASNVQQAIEILQGNDFHLLIADLFMPLRVNENANPKGGEVLIKEIYKSKNKTTTPIYIIGLTQFDEYIDNFSAVWRVWKYDSSSEDWKIRLRDLVFHISKINSKIIKTKKETIFVEGPTDKLILELSFKLFYPNQQKFVEIETITYGGGASWVERQLIIWGKTLFWKNKDKTEYLKAIGVFDDDDAGRKSIESIRSQIQNNSAESKTFAILKFDKKYARHLIPIFKNGIELPITLEEMYSPSSWVYAEKQNWLSERRINHAIPILNEDIIKYFKYKVNDENKWKFANYIKSQEIEFQKEILRSFEQFLKDLLLKLKIDSRI